VKKLKSVYIVLLNILILLGAIFVQYKPTPENKEDPPFYLGVTFCGETIAEAKLLIDKTKNYTNLFVLQSGPISKNESAINEICNYAFESGLNIIVYFGWFDNDHPWQIPWLDYAKKQWADNFLGVYYYDEPGGTQIDYNWSRLFMGMKEQNSTIYQTFSPTIESYLQGTLQRDYDEAASHFISSLQNNQDIKELKNRAIATFTSDYALYWFDYLGGYDVVFAEFGWNNSIVQEIALVRGAAQIQNKSWGAIITWKYMDQPYLDTGDTIYYQMRTAYSAGAKYVVIFNYAEINGYSCSIMQDEHFEALERLWNDIRSEQKTEQGSIKAEHLLVLPKNYGYGMRRPDDKIWYWGADEETTQIWSHTRKLVLQYGLKLDITYEEPMYPITNQYALVF
jgi:hypothetical protein